MTTFIIIICLILILSIFLTVYMVKRNSELKKELKNIKETVNAIQEKEKEYADIKEGFNDSVSGVSSTIDFLQNHERS